jgi:citrate lyase beta subunit
MALPFRILHFSTILPGAAFLRLTHRIEARDVQVVFDLEDTHWDPGDARRTAERKSTARHLLLSLAEARVAAGMPPLSVRVNGLQSPESEADVALLGELARRGPIRAVVLPKVEEPGMVEEFLGRTSVVGASPPEVIPLVETRRAVENLGALLAGLRARREDGRVRRVMYGAFDHCLDVGRWPFWEQDTAGFWEFLEGLVARVEDQRLEYVHTPIDSIADARLFRQLVGRLGEVCRRPYSVSTLTETQVRAVLEPPAEPEPSLELRHPIADAAEALARARQVVAAYHERRRRGQGFVTDARVERFISPHEVVAAQAYLEAHRG